MSGARRKIRPGDFARRLASEWRRLGLPTADARVVVAVSGGADSTALLLACDELIRAGRLKVSLLVAHLDHGLRGAEGEADAAWVAGLARSLGHDAAAGRASVTARARESADNLEQTARRARYEFLAGAARANGSRWVLTAHTLEDQAETVLLALARGSGAEGLGGMRPVRALDNELPRVTLARPLLSWARRAETENYCRARGAEWRADAMNEDERYARVRVRRRLLPLLETLNPRAAEALARAADLLREDSAVLDDAAARLLEEAADAGAWSRLSKPAAGGSKRSDAGAGKSERAVAAEEESEKVGGPPDEGSRGVPPLRVETLAAAGAALRRRALRLWLAGGRGHLRRLELQHVAAVERLLAGERGGRVAELPGGCSVVRRRRWLFFRDGRTEEKS